jgi:transcriptional regulator with XRE-family HTH domain
MSSKKIPNKLGPKLREIRKHKGWTLDQMAETLGKTGVSKRTRVYEWEIGIRQPDLGSLLIYAKLIGVSTDVLIDDNVDLNL